MYGGDDQGLHRLQQPAGNKPRGTYAPIARHGIRLKILTSFYRRLQSRIRKAFEELA